MRKQERAVPPPAVRMIETTKMAKSESAESSSPIQHNLPREMTSFVGREKELLQIGAMLDDSNIRLVTLVGMGGVGKTRLALQALRQQLPNFADGVWYIDMIPLQTADELLSATGQALGLVFNGLFSLKQQLVDHVKEKRLLWLFDNFEHMVESAVLVSDLLQEIPQLTVLVTSREVLDLAEEWLYQVDGLSYPERETTGVPPPSTPLLTGTRQVFTAVHLFAQRAR